MPKRTDLNSILVIGAGPIIIGQGCEFDYSGTQACKALKEEGYKVILVNSNPATIMTDPDTADKTYIEPVTPDVIKKIIRLEKPDAILPTIGGQTGLNAVVRISDSGFLQKYKVELIGADIKAIKKAEDRREFREAMTRIGLKTARSGYARSLEQALDVCKEISFPLILRPSYTLGGTGGSIAYNFEEFKDLTQKALQHSMNGVMIEQSLWGWKEFELEVMKDSVDNVIIICSIENIDPMGIHTGDSITVAPQQTLSDKEYQHLRDMAIKIIREIGVSTGGSNIQFAVNPDNREVLVIEMNPRVSRSSALASKATGFPIAKIAAKLAVGYRLDEIPNDITGSTPSSFEPSMDYVVTKMPRFAFEKFKSSSTQLGVQMKSVGETMSIGRTFKESFQKAIRGLEIKKSGFDGIYFSYQRILESKRKSINLKEMIQKISKRHVERIRYQVKSSHDKIFYIKDAFYINITIDEIHELTKIDSWFLFNLFEIYHLEQETLGKKLSELSKEDFLHLKGNGFSDEQIAYMTESTEEDVASYRMKMDVLPVFKMVDTCAAEFEAKTPYYYSTYDEEDESVSSQRERIMILGGGPNRIGQGIEFDYMCVQASFALQELGYETIMVNSNPETVSTDYDVSNVLFFDPLTYEDVMAIIKSVNPKGVIVQLGGQTPLNLSQRLAKENVPILGTSARSTALAEDRDQFKKILDHYGFKQPSNDITFTAPEAVKIAKRIGYPVVVRPSYVLGGRAMEIVFDNDDLKKYLQLAIEASPDQPILIDKYLERAVEVDVDLICDGEEVIICGIMEHIEEAGVHSGDSACVIPSQNISGEMLDQIKLQATKMALALEIKGLMNVQFAIQNNSLYFLEVNPRGSRTVPFVSKATGIPWINYAVKIMADKKIKDLEIKISNMPYVAVKEAVFPFDKFPNEDTVLGPEMKSTGEVMGLGSNIGQAYYKAQLGAGTPLPKSGGVLVTVKTKDYPDIIMACKILIKMNFKLYATEGTRKYLAQNNIPSEFVYKYGEGRPDIRDKILNKYINLIFNTPIGKKEKQTDIYIRLLAKEHRIPIMTTVPGMAAAAKAISEIGKQDQGVMSLQDYYSIRGQYKI